MNVLQTKSLAKLSQIKWLCLLANNVLNMQKKTIVKISLLLVQQLQHLLLLVKKGLEVLKGYDWLIIDEVSKCPITEVLRYLPYISKIIMVGDDFQLAPLLEFSKDDVKEF